MRRALPILVIAGAVLLVGFAIKFFFFKGGDAGQGGFPGGGMPPSSVETVKLQATSAPNLFETVGTLRSSESITVRPEVGGTIERIHFADGQQVARGALLFTMDDALVRADLNEANANLQNSRRAHDRARELAARQLIARADLDKAAAEFAVNNARAA